MGLSAEYVRKILAYFRGNVFPEEKRFLDSEVCRLITADLSESDGGVKQEYLDFIPTVQMQEKTGRQVRRIASELILTLLLPDFGAALRIDSLICSLLGGLSDPANYHHTRVTLDAVGESLIFSRISRLIEEQNGRISRAELERRLNYSGHHINYIVGKYSGMCLYDYCMGFCMKKAARDLKNTTASVSEIASGLGFSNRTHFYSLFKKAYGLTPRQYRAAHAGAAQTQTSGNA